MSRLPGIPRAESVVREILETRTGRTVLRVTSSSMSPCLEEGDRIEVEPVSPERLWPGDVVLYASETSDLVVHRLIWRDPPLGRPKRVFTKGDALGYLDRSFTADRVLGRVVGVQRGEGRSGPATSLGDRLRCLLLAARHGVRRVVHSGPVSRTRSRLSEAEEIR